MVGELNETVSNAINWESGKSLFVNVLDYARSAMLNISTFISKYVPFDEKIIYLGLFGILSLYIAGKFSDPRRNGNIWIILGILVFYFSVFWTGGTG